MTKAKFIQRYQTSKIRVLFNYDVFIRDDTISVVEETIALSEMLAYFVPKYKKDCKLDRREIIEQIADHTVMPLTVAEVFPDPVKWDLYLEELPEINALEPIPVATDASTGKSLILDSNHTLVSLINRMDPASIEAIKVAVVRVIGNPLNSQLIDDFKIIKRY